MQCAALEIEWFHEFLSTLGPAMRGPSPLLRPGKLLRAQRSSGENSFDLELGASATRVHQLPPSVVRNRRLSPKAAQHHRSLGE